MTLQRRRRQPFEHRPSGGSGRCGAERDRQRELDRIAKETGAVHIDAQTTEPHTYFRQIAEELRTSYELGYYPTNTAKDDSFRKVVIRAKRPGLTVRSKTGYFSR